MKRILALITKMFMDTSDVVFCLPTAMTALRAFCETVLGMSQTCGGLLTILGILDDLPVAIGNQIPNAHIEANCIVFAWQGRWRRFTDALEIPA